MAVAGWANTDRTALQMTTTWLRRARAARPREVWVLGAVFGLVPSTLGMLPLLTGVIGLCGLMLVRTWRLRLIVTLFVVAELLGLPWPAAPILAAAAWFTCNSIAFGAGSWLRRPRGARLQWLLVLAAAVGCGFVVVALDWWNISTGYVFPLPVPPTWSFPLFAIGAAIVNALGEEALWRGLLADVGEAATTRASNVAVQALSFGLAHYHGIPNGPLGVVAATVFSAFLYLVGLRLGRAGALVAHLATDLVIFLAVIQYAQFAWNG